MSYYINMALNEGEQAQKYKEHKAYDKLEKNFAFKDRRNNKEDDFGAGYKDRMTRTGNALRNDIFNGIPSKQQEENLKRRIKANNMAYNTNSDHDIYKRYKNNPDIDLGNAKDRDISIARDAANRHLRRHPKQESSIFSECNFIEFAY